MRVAKRRYFFKGNQNGYISHLEEYVANLAKYAGDLESLVDKANIQWKRLPLVAEIQEQDTANSREVLTPQEGSQGHREGGSFTFQLVNKPQDRLTPTNSFLSRLPKNEEEWSQKRINVQFATSEQMAQLFDLLTRRSGQISFPDIGSKPDFGANFGQIAKDYSKLVRAMRVKSELSTQLKHYSHLVFNCICVVVLELGMPLDEVDQLSRDFVDNSGQSSRYMSRLRAASKWIAQHSESLESSLQHRAPELFFMWGVSMFEYRSIFECPRNRQFFLSETTKVSETFKEIAKNETRISLSPAFLLTSMGFRRQDVNKALGTKLSEESFNTRLHAVEHIKSYHQQAMAMMTVNPMTVLVEAASLGLDVSEVRTSVGCNQVQDMAALSPQVSHKHASLRSDAFMGNTIPAYFTSLLRENGSI